MCIFYTYSQSVWAAVPELAILELGYPPDAIKKEVIDLGKGENFDPAFLKINPKGTLPTLVAKGKAYISTAEVTAYLVGHAPKRVTAGTSLIATIHEEKYDPNAFSLLARSDEELKQKYPYLIDFIKNRQEAIDRHAAHPDAAEHQPLYDSKRETNGPLLAIYEGTAPQEHKDAFFKIALAHWDNLKQFLSNELPGLLPDKGFRGGENPGEDDFHLAAWLARVVVATGGKDQDGTQSLANSFGIDIDPKISAYLSAWGSRASWKEVYANGLH